MQFIILMCCVVSIIISVLCLTVSMKNKNTDEYKRVNQQLDMMSQTFAAQISTLYDQLNRQNNLMVNNITALDAKYVQSPSLLSIRKYSTASLPSGTLPGESVYL